MVEPLRQACFFLDENMERSSLFEVAGGTAAVFSARSPAKEAPNEDAAAILPYGDELAVLVVADGVGGAQSGEVASGLVARHLEVEVGNRPPSGEELRYALLGAIEHANEELIRLGLGAATTLAVAIIEGARLRTFHVGDSMVLVAGQRGRVKLQTISHSPVGYAVEAGLLDEEEAMHHSERHLISNMVGAPDMRIEMGASIELAPRDTVLLATDGVFDNLRVEEVVQRIRKGRLEVGAARLAEDCLCRMHSPREGQPSKADDLTFIAWRRRGPSS